MRAALVVLCAATLAGPVAGQEPVIRRAQPKAFPFAVTPNVGIGFGAVRARYYDTTTCASANNCYDFGTGSGAQGGAELQLPLGRYLGFEVGGQVGRPSLKQCLRGQCASVGRIWAYRGTGTLLFRFKPRAPVYFGLGGAYTYFKSGPVLAYQEGLSVGEYGFTTVVGIDFPFTERMGGRVVWRSYVLIPSDKGLPEDYVLPSAAWDNALTFGVRFHLGG